jgi:CDGSH-type Zn-finger protein/uncharacterized Fe-S cluster protein YjdI
MDTQTSPQRPDPTRELLLHALYEAAELEHNLMCTYLYAAFSLRDGETEGLSTSEAAAVARWRHTILHVAIDEMGHLVAVWNITAALGGSPRFGRTNFPLDVGILPAGITVKLAPFSEAALQHFIHLERPAASEEREGDGFASEFKFKRGNPRQRLTPMGIDYETVGVFYAMLGANLKSLVERIGEDAVFCGDPALQLSRADVPMEWAKTVSCLDTAIAAFDAIVEQGEGALTPTKDSHFQRFVEIRNEFAALKAANPNFKPAWPAAVNPVQRPPVRASGRVWIEDEHAAQTVDIANAAYALMLRLMAYAYVVPRPSPEKALAVDLSLGLMRAMTHLAEHAARLPAGPSNPDCNAGMSFVALRDAAPLPLGPAARRFFVERLSELSEAAARLNIAAGDTKRVAAAARQFGDLAKRAARGFETADSEIPSVARTPAMRSQPLVAPAALIRKVDAGVETLIGEKVSVLYDSKKCVWAHFCVSGGPQAFLGDATEKGWIFPDAMDADELVAVVRQCPSGALQYERHDGKADESAPPINQIVLREAGPYALRGDIRLEGKPIRYRAALCRCGASKNKPFCDASHIDANFSASGEPPSGQADMLDARDGSLMVDPETNGPLQLRGNLEIVSGTGRTILRTTQARLCRCGGSATKPFCDGTHQRNGFKSE